MIARFTSVLLFAIAALPFSVETACGEDSGVTEVPIYTSNSASVAAVLAGDSVDLVIVDAGYDRDFCTGACCRVERNEELVAEIIIAEADDTKAVALITNLENNQTIKTGDTVNLKTI